MDHGALTPSGGMVFDLDSALEWALDGRTEAWVHAYLAAGPWANLPLSEGLHRSPRYWRGPLRVGLDTLTRCCGPEPSTEFHIGAEQWNVRVDVLARGLTTVEALPPLIVEYRGGQLSVRDGNHRLEAMRRRGWAECWVIVWYNAARDLPEGSPPGWHGGLVR